jgi:hypothetical protein
MSVVGLLRLAVIALCVAGCGAASTSSATSASPTGTNPSAGSASPTAATSWTEQLAFSGPVNGSATEGIINSGSMCSGAQSIPGHYLEVHFDTVIAGTTYHLVLHAMYIAGAGVTAIDSNAQTVAASITTPGYASGLVPPGSATTAAPAQGTRFITDGGSITVAAGGEQGAVDVTMEAVPSGDPNAEHMSGSWSCTTLTPPTGSTPEGLAFSGDISGQMTAATPDPATGAAPAVCAPFSGQSFGGSGISVHINGTVQGLRWAVEFSLAVARVAAGAYRSDFASGTIITVQILAGTGNPDSRDWLSDTRASDPEAITLNAGLLSGTVNLIAKPRVSSSTGPTSAPTLVHITGNFTCAQAATP